MEYVIEKCGFSRKKVQNKTTCKLEHTSSVFVSQLFSAYELSGLWKMV